MVALHYRWVLRAFLVGKGAVDGGHGIEDRLDELAPLFSLSVAAFWIPRHVPGQALPWQRIGRWKPPAGCGSLAAALPSSYNAYPCPTLTVYAMMLLRLTPLEIAGIAVALAVTAVAVLPRINSATQF